MVSSCNLVKAAWVVVVSGDGKLAHALHRGNPACSK